MNQHRPKGCVFSVRWFGEYSFDGPPALPPLFGGPLRNPKVVAQIGKAPSKTQNCVFCVHSGVSILLRACRPSTISRLIVAIIVDPVYRKTWRALSHIRKEIFKLLPPLTYSDSSACVIWMIPDSTSSLHVGPRSKCSRAASVPSRSVSHEISPSNISPQAATRGRVSGFEVVIPDNNQGPAGALANALRPTRFSFLMADHGQPCEYGPDRDIIPFTHSIACFNVVISDRRVASTARLSRHYPKPSRGQVN